MSKLDLHPPAPISHKHTHSPFHKYLYIAVRLFPVKNEEHDVLFNIDECKLQPLAGLFSETGYRTHSSSKNRPKVISHKQGRKK